jgi:hypothetical protein
MFGSDKQPYRQMQPSRPPAIQSESTSWALIVQVMNLVLLFVIAIVLIVIMSVVLYHRADFVDLVDSFRTLAELADDADPVVTFLSRAADGITVDPTATLARAMPDNEDDAARLLAELVTNLKGALALADAVHTSGVTGDVATIVRNARDAVSDPSATSAAKSVARTMEWFGNRTADGSIDSGAAFVKHTVAYGMNLTSEESETFLTAKMIGESLQPLVSDLNTIVHSFRELQSSPMYVDLWRRMMVVVDQFIEGPRLTKLVDNWHRIWEGAAKLVEYASSDRAVEKVDTLFGMLPMITNTGVAVVDGFRSGGLNLRLGG